MNEDKTDLLTTLLSQYPHEERSAWIAEIKRLSTIVEAFVALKPKRHYERNNDGSGVKVVFSPQAIMLCAQAAATDPIIVKREPHRGKPLSPFTLDRWSRAYCKDGASIFLRDNREYSEVRITDGRLSTVTREAVEWMQNNWRSYSGPHRLYLDWSKESKRNGWKIPAESWLYRRWSDIPGIVKIVREIGWNAYVSKYAPYVPRDLSDLTALQVLCGDHSERDVFVNDGGKARRPWLTVWQDLRTSLIWGWYLERRPSSETAALAYADGILNFGAQPPARPDEEFCSYIYTDQGRDYKSHDWTGKEIEVHQQAMKASGELEMFLMQRSVGIPEEFQIGHLFARGYNAREKPVERLFKTISAWEKDEFDSYCGSSPSTRPEKLKDLFSRQKEFERGNRKSSPFIDWEEYKAKLSDFISDFNHSSHIRTNLGGETTIVPIEEYKELYRIRYDISPETVSLMLMKPGSRVLQKNGVNCFKRGWFYWCNEMSKYKGDEKKKDKIKVEIRYTDRDYSSIWVVLPDKKPYEAKLLQGSSLLKPNKETLRRVAEAKAHERNLINGFGLLAQSIHREVSIEEKVLQESSTNSTERKDLEVQELERIYKMTRLEKETLASDNIGPSSIITEVDDYKSKPKSLKRKPVINEV